MPSGQLMTMPILIINMGGEMVYILQQRLEAQKIPEPKGQKVLSDVIRTMYYPRFVEELFKPQEMYTIQSTRQIFDRLAHSSIMRLNESSMEKLFDLMAMGFKYQIISCKSPAEVVDVTLNHLESLKWLIRSNESLKDLLQESVGQVNTFFRNMQHADLNALRQSLCAFFQDRKVKVSLFLHDRTQNNDGSIVVPSGGTLPDGASIPGTVRYFSGGVEDRREQLNIVSATAWKLGSGTRTSLGANLYDKDRSAAKAAGGSCPPGAVREPSRMPEKIAEEDASKTAAAVGELNLLASLIGAQPPSSGSETFKLESLFGANVFERGDRGRNDVISIDGSAPSDFRAGLENVRKQMEGIQVSEEEDADDLLDLMDKA